MSVPWRRRSVAWRRLVSGGCWPRPDPASARHYVLSQAICLFFLVNCEFWAQGAGNQDEIKDPTVSVVLLARNKEHVLPYFLTLFERLNYPKKRMALYIRSDHNVDLTIPILEEWLAHNKQNYHYIDAKLDKHSPKFYPEDEEGTEWSNARFTKVMELKEELLDKARHSWADYVWFLDMDVFLTNRDILLKIMSEEKAVVAPMLNSLATYSNYWGGMTEDYWYTRSDDYIPILDRKQMGCFDVPMVHSCVLVDLTRVASDNLTFIPKNLPGYKGPHDDIIAFAISAKNAGLPMHVCNSEIYGFIPPPLEDGQGLHIDMKQLLSIKLEVLVEHPPLPVSKLLAKYTPPPPKIDNVGFDQIYLINLARRLERRDRMFQSFRELGLKVKLFEAVDGKQLNDSYLRQLGVKQMVGYKDPWSKRDMTFGEIGCFLSHYFIWVDIVNHGYNKVLLFEDDIRFEPYFKEKLKMMREEADSLLDWDLIYLGRKKMKSADEPWTDWMEKFPVRNLNAYSVAPLYVFPTHYTGEDGYISDTEESPIIVEDAVAPAMSPSLGGKGLELEIGFNGLAKDEL
ncbi:Glycosyltransferase 25 family member [Portunus trituberculatus]|uniref:Glycosyltransferase 25 family member n=1 Tax=Portunus trituberculatus TaxID=210409 RepID=A0A5B7DXZ6_PORTR|nr:Glycosyltransferase 25 family member [Portunus trituberculatus]